MDISQVEAGLTLAFDKAYEARETLYFATENYEKAKLIRDQKQALAIYNGEIEGKNVEQRQAHAEILLITEISQENEAAEVLRDAKLTYDLAMLELSRAKSMLRLLEAMAGIESK
jgi:hypothetical protein